MHIELPWLGIILLPVVALVAWRSRPLEPAGRWLLRTATLLLWLAATGVQLRCDREVRVVALVDVSPSTRGAAFRGPMAVDAKLKQLVPNRRVEIRYFADGRVTTPSESASQQTRLPPTDADAVILMSDGRFEAPAAMPPVYAVVDPSLDSSADARIDDIRVESSTARISAYAPTSDRSLVLGPGTPPLAVPAGPSVLSAAATQATVRASITPADAWPENNAMSAVAEPPTNAEPWIITDPTQLPTDAAAYLEPPVIAISASLELSTVQAERLTQYVRDLGGSLVIVGSPRKIAPALRPLSPLTGVPPKPEAEWMILLDASGSMASGPRGDSRWDRALSAATDAVGRLDDPQRVSIAVFSRSAENVADSISPAEAAAKLRSLATRLPSGPTGLESALTSVATRTSASPTRLLLVTDADATIGSPDALADRLVAAKVSVFVLATGTITPDAAVRRIVDKSDGALIEQADSSKWSTALQSLLDSASGEDTIPLAPVTTSGTLAGASLDAEQLFRAFSRSDVELLARTNDQPVAATWQVGLGRVTTIAAQLPAPTIKRMSERFKRSPADPRFSVSWGDDSAVLTATDATGPLNGLPLALIDGTGRLDFEQTAPGRYEIRIARSDQPRIVRVVWDGSLVATRAIPGRYPVEFDATGNDRASLEALASRTGGAVLEASQASPIELPRATEWRSTTHVLATLGLLTLGLAIVFIRAPYLADRLARYARRSVR